MYEKTMTDPMKQELVRAGVEDLASEEAVSTFFGKSADSSAVVFINSVCGCSAGTARPAFINSLTHSVKPKHIATVFAGVDKEATDAARERIVGCAPSSPSIAFFRNDELVFFLERKHIEGFDARSLERAILSAYDKYAGGEINPQVEAKTPIEFMEKSIQEVAETLKERKEEITLLDCRTPEERDIVEIADSTLITKELAEEIIKEWDRKREIIIYCHHGGRSLQAVSYFNQHGFENCYSMAGGIDAWARQIDTSLPTY